MWDAQGVALVIASTTSLMALGVPFVQRLLEDRDRRREAKKDQLEGLLFFVLNNYAAQRAALDKHMFDTFVWQVTNDLTSWKAIAERKESKFVEGFNAQFVNLRMRKNLYSIDDDRFCDCVDEYMVRAAPVPTAPEGDPEKFGRDSQAISEYRTEAYHQIEAKSVTFLRNIERRFE